MLSLPLDDSFLRLANCSAGLWKSLENGSRNLTPARAALLEAATGVSRLWLLENKPTSPPVNVFGEPFTKEFFVSYRAAKLKGGHGVAFNPFAMIPRLTGIAHAAEIDGRLPEFIVALEEATERLESNFGNESRAAQALLDWMSKRPTNYAWEVADSEIRADQEIRLQQQVLLLKKGRVMPLHTTQALHKKAVHIQATLTTPQGQKSVRSRRATKKKIKQPS